MSKALIVSYYFPPFNGPGTQHPTWFYRFLRDHGFDTIALTSSVYFGMPAGPQPPPDPGVLRLPDNVRTRKYCHHLYRAELWTQQQFKTWEPGFLWGAMFGVPAATRILHRERFDAMISVSSPVSSHWTALQIKRRFPELKWIADFTDPFVGNPFSKEGAGGPISRALERAIFSTADYLSANTDTVQAMWRRHYPRYRDKMVVTWGGYDPGESVAASPLGPGETPVLKYVGALYGGRVPTVLLRSLERLVAQGRLRRGDLITEFFGALDFGPLEPVVAALANQGFIRLRPTYVPRPEALEAAASAHYSLLLDITGVHNTTLQVPAKLFDQIRIGRPILAFTPPESPSERILADSGILHVSLAPNAPPEEVDAGVLRLLQMPSTPQLASPWFRETFDARHLAGLMAARIRGERE